MTDLTSEQTERGESNEAFESDETEAEGVQINTASAGAPTDCVASISMIPSASMF